MKLSNNLAVEQRVKDIIKRLNILADEEKVSIKSKKFGIVATNSLGVYHKDLKVIAKEIGTDSELALALFDSNIYEARILCSKIFDPADLTEPLMDSWVKTFENWEICDSFSIALFAKSKFAVKKSKSWTSRKREFVKRAGFATIAAYCMADKRAINEVFESFFPLILKEAIDERLYVKKAISWALRNIGKRNIDLNKAAKELSRKLLKLNSKSARWIAKDALNELTKENVRMSDYPRSIYSPN